MEETTTQQPQTEQQQPQAEEAKPFLGDGNPGDDAQTPSTETAKAVEPAQPQNVTEPKTATEEDYLKAVAKDEQLLGTDKNVQIDQGLVKAIVPVAQELGVPPEAVNKLANALAKAQVDNARKAQQERIEYFNRMKDDSVKKYSPNDFAQINAGIDHWFKPGGTMNSVIRSSELGADPEFLALMHYLGSKRTMDKLNGVSAGGDGSSPDPNSIEGLAKMW